MKCVRIHAEPTVDNPDAPAIYVDAILDQASKIAGLHTLFGMQGSFEKKEEEYFPFTLDLNGKIDFGTAYDTDLKERYSEFDLRDGTIAKGRLLTLESPIYGTQRYRIAKLIVLSTVA